MKFVLAAYGSRGDVEPFVAIGRELQSRGHDVCMAVSPNMLGLVESVGLAAVAYGPDPREQSNPAADLIRKSTQTPNLFGILSDVIAHVSRVKAGKTSTLASLANGADLMLASSSEQGLTANIAELQGIPVAGLHLFPMKALSSGGVYSSVTKQTDDAQRRELGLPEADPEVVAAAPWEIQAYEEFYLPGPAADWVEQNGRRPFVGALTLESPADADDEVLSWIAQGTPPIYFGFGSTPIDAPADAVAMIVGACAQLGERALICAGDNDFGGAASDSGDVKIVKAVSHTAVFPACRAVVHHGGAGTTAAGLRAGVPTLTLWFWLDQPLWTAGLGRLGAGAGRPFYASTVASLVADLNSILTPQCTTRAREAATRMTSPAGAVSAVADLLEEIARAGRDD